MKGTMKLLVSFLILSSSFAAQPLQKIELTTGSVTDKEAMAYSRDRLTAKAGTQITLVFKNASSTKGTISNFVLVRPGKAQSVIDASVSVGSAHGWVAPSGDVIVKSKLIDAGETDTLEFTAPLEVGDYPYVSTVPGHATMRGILKVTK